MSNKSSRLSFLDRYLTLWIFAAMALGILIGWGMPSISTSLSKIAVGTTSIPIAIGLIVMMYPPFAKIDYKKLKNAFTNKKAMLTAIIASWFVGPICMFILSVLFLRNYPHYMIGLIIIGISTCVAMVIMWNGLADGDNEFAAAVVAVNALFQVFFYSIYMYLFVSVFPRLLGLEGVDVHVTIGEVATSVAIYLGIPFVTGMLTKVILENKKGEKWYKEVFVPKISPVALIALLFTIVLMFSFKGKYIVELPMDVIRIAIPLVIYFILVFCILFLLVTKWGSTIKKQFQYL